MAPLTKHASGVAEASSPGISAEVIERAAEAIKDAEVGYHLKMTGLVDGVSTYTLTYDDGSPVLEFVGWDAASQAYAHIAARKANAQATAALTAALGDKYVIVPREPDNAVLDAIFEECKEAWGKGVLEYKARPINGKWTEREIAKPFYRAALASKHTG